MTGANEQTLIDRIMESWEVPLREYLKSTPLRVPASVLLSHLTVRDSRTFISFKPSSYRKGYKGELVRFQEFMKILYEGPSSSLTSTRVAFENGKSDPIMFHKTLNCFSCF